MSRKITRFEDLIAWQKARVLAGTVYTLTRREAFAKDFGLTNQMQRAAVSIMSNIAEGFERGSQAEFKRFVTIAKASCAELRSQLYIAHDIGYLDKPSFQSTFYQTEEVARILGGLKTSIQPSDNP